MKRLMIVFGIFYIALSILNIFNSFHYNTPYNLLWFCSIGIFLIGLGIITQNKAIIQSQIYILFIPDIIWTVDFLFRILIGNSLLGVADYFLASETMLQRIVSFQHVLTVPLIIYLMYQHRFQKNKVWLISCAQWAVFWIISRIFTSQENNINCTYHFCGNYFLGASQQTYTLLWLATGFLMIYITQLIIIRISQQWPRKPKKSKN